MKNSGQQHKKTAIIHIGHGKTGSSAIQTYLAQNRTGLASKNINYPFHKSLDWAKDGKISSGNGRLLLDLKNAVGNDLYSDETLCARLDDEKIAGIQSLYKDGVNYICYTRDFFDHAVSAWGQNVKRSGYKFGFYRFMKNVYGGHLNQLLSWLERAQEQDLNLKVFNYSRHRHNIVGHFAHLILGASSDDFLTQFPPQQAVVNRSLTLAEYEVQRLMNVHFPKKTSTFVSDVFVNELPNIKSERPKINRELYEFARNKFLPVIEAINVYLPEAERLAFEDFDTINKPAESLQTDTLRLSKQQLETFIRSLSRALIQPDIGRFDRIANNYMRKELICEDDAKYLFSVLRSVRPDYPVSDEGEFSRPVRGAIEQSKLSAGLWRLARLFKNRW